MAAGMETSIVMRMAFVTCFLVFLYSLRTYEVAIYFFSELRKMIGNTHAPLISSQEDKPELVGAQ